jgi:hypothetical protein
MNTKRKKLKRRKKDIILKDSGREVKIPPNKKKNIELSETG